MSKFKHITSENKDKSTIIDALTLKSFTKFYLNSLGPPGGDEFSLVGPAN